MTLDKLKCVRQVSCLILRIQYIHKYSSVQKNLKYVFLFATPGRTEMYTIFTPMMNVLQIVN